MQFFAFGTTSQCADYIKISNESQLQYGQQNTSNLRILFPLYLKNGLILLNLDLLRLLSPEGHGVSKCKFTCHSAGIEPVIALVNARVRVHVFLINNRVS
ncbi:hypothetical protein O3M35_009134 [Rhynocoris fuscipes]|uniref:Uncharacterized protein n=1 Tax=Rhynocoris fuscipes TaxID=488301 RepID=A0AAW1D2N7_9HEMI